MLFLPFNALSEGGKNLTPANTGVLTGVNQSVGFLQNGDGNNSSSFLATPTEGGFNPLHRLMVRIKPGEILYFGLQRNDVNGITNTIVRVQFRRLDNNTIVSTTNLGSGGTALTAGAGVIASYAAMVAGPSAIVGAAGYNAASYTFPGIETLPVDLAIEILDDGVSSALTATTNRDFYNLWDFSVYSGTTEKVGRLHSKYWSFNANGGTNRLSSTFQLLTAVPDVSGNNYYIKSINLAGMQPYGFFFTSNSTGTLKDPAGVLTADYKSRRKSRNFYAGVFGDGYPEYDNFVSNPDPEFWPSATVTNPIITPVSKCNTARANGGAIDITFSTAAPGIAIILLDLNNVDGYQPATKDILIETELTSAGTTIVPWDGLDGLGANVPSGTAFKTVFRFGSYPVHYPLYDVENNSDGFAIFDERPSPPSTPAIAFWDDNSIVAGSEELFGVKSSGAVHPWGGLGTGILANNIGDTKLLNTWVYGQLREIKNTYLHTYSCVTLPPVANNFTNLPMPQTNGATLIPALTASDPDGTIISFTITSIPLVTEGILTYCSNSTEPCTGTVTPIGVNTILTTAQVATIKFDPAPAFSGTAQFTFIATDNSGNFSNPATYKLPVVAQPPIANNLIVPSMVNTNGPTAIAALSASDADGIISTYTILTVPVGTQGVLTYCSNGTEPCTGAVTVISANTPLTPAQIGTLKFDPAAGFTGNATFNYTATDNSGNLSNIANYTIPVTATVTSSTPPLVNNIYAQPINNSSDVTAIPSLKASDIGGTVVSYTINTIPPAGQGVLSYCPLAPGACTPAQLVLVTIGLTLTPAQAASLYFDPVATFLGNAVFTYTATDNDGNIGNVGNYTITVNNNPPTVSNIIASVLFNATATAIPAISGADGDGTIAQYTVAIIPNPATGVLLYCPLAPGACTPAQLVAVSAGQNLTLAQANSLFFDPATGFSGTTGFGYTATDNNGNVSQFGVYAITITNQSPVAQTITISTIPNTNGQTAITSLVATDQDGTIASYTIQTLPVASEGVLFVNGVAVTLGQVLTPLQISQLTFDPNPAFTGVVSVAYSATDNSGNPSNLAFINIPVSGTGNIPPIAVPIISAVINSNSSATNIPALAATDPDGTIASYTIQTLPQLFQGVLSLSGTPVTIGQVLTLAQISQLQFDPAANFTGNAIFTYSATDNSGSKSSDVNYSIPVNSQPPIANAIVAPTMPNSNGATNIPALAAVDQDGTIVSYFISTLPLVSQGVLLLSGTPVTVGQVLTPLQISQLQFDPAAGYTGEVVFNYFATDNTTLSSNVATYTLFVSGFSPVSLDVVATAIDNTSGSTAISILNSNDADGTITTYTINSIPPVSQGVLSLNGTPVIAGQLLTPAQISQLQFDPAPNFIGNALFNYTATDNGGSQSNTATYVIPVISLIPVPINLLSFDGKLAGGKTNLTWTTAQEFNADHFEVERSNTDGAGYKTLGTVAATGNSSVDQNYLFTDNNPVSGLNYYRLKMVDKDGKFKFSSIVLIRVNVGARINIWPNPFTEKVQVTIHQEKAGILQVRISDVSGKVVKLKNVTVLKGSNQFTVDNMNILLPGVYFIELNNNSTTKEFKKIIKK